jgi:hypothetical protein
MSDHLEDQSKNETHSSFFKSLPKPQRAAFLFLSALSLGVLVLWLWQFNARLSRPFRVPDTGEKEVAVDTGDFEAALISLDSDGDGLTDIEERSLYASSPYLEDSDSDGINDRAEVEGGSDPNCATGQNCGTATAPAITPIIASSTTIDVEPETGADSGDETDLQAMMAGQASAAQLRAMLLDSGANADMINQLSDEELIKTYQEMLAEQGDSAQ